MNREAERYRLITMLYDSKIIHDNTINEGIAHHTILKLADHLLANGIVVPPFKIGETLHDISEYVYGIPSPEIYEMENDRMTIEKLENGDFIFIYEDAEIRHEDMGEVIFTTREEAEAKLGGKEDA